MPDSLGRFRGSLVWAHKYCPSWTKEDILTTAEKHGKMLTWGAITVDHRVLSKIRHFQGTTKPTIEVNLLSYIHKKPKHWSAPRICNASVSTVSVCNLKSAVCENSLNLSAWKPLQKRSMRFPGVYCLLEMENTTRYHASPGSVGNVAQSKAKPFLTKFGDSCRCCWYARRLDWLKSVARVGRRRGREGCV